MADYGAVAYLHSIAGLTDPRVCPKDLTDTYHRPPSHIHTTLQRSLFLGKSLYIASINKTKLQHGASEMITPCRARRRTPILGRIHISRKRKKPSVFFSILFVHPYTQQLLTIVPLINTDKRRFYYNRRISLPLRRTPQANN